MKKLTSNIFYTVVFWGSLWGISEATLGHVLHLVPVVSGIIMFPIGLYFMKKSHDASGNSVSVVLTAAVAACIKLIDIFFPIVGIERVINPAIAILLQGAFVLAANFIYGKRMFSAFTSIALLCMGWRAVFLVYDLILFYAGIHIELISGGIFPIMKYLLIDSIATGIIIYFFFNYFYSASTRREIKPYFAFALLFAAVMTRVMLLV